VPVVLTLILYPSLYLSHLIAFTAKELQPSLVSLLVLAYAQHVLIEGFPFADFERRFLPSISSICRHTGIVHIFRDQGKLQSLRYIWTHRNIYPWGQPLPVQCDKCGRIRPWISVNGRDSSCLFACRGCPKKLNFPPPESVKWVGSEVAGGQWMVIEQEKYLRDGLIYTKE
jgi:hypothetical protein